jgi:hypothetical protein
MHYISRPHYFSFLLLLLLLLNKNLIQLNYYINCIILYFVRKSFDFVCFFLLILTLWLVFGVLSFALKKVRRQSNWVIVVASAFIVKYTTINFQIVWVKISLYTMRIDYFQNTWYKEVLCCAIELVLLVNLLFYLDRINMSISKRLLISGSAQKALCCAYLDRGLFLPYKISMFYRHQYTHIYIWKCVSLFV